jgi:hypothetical protein
VTALLVLRLCDPQGYLQGGQGARSGRARGLGCRGGGQGRAAAPAVARPQHSGAAGRGVAGLATGARARAAAAAASAAALAWLPGPRLQRRSPNAGSGSPAPTGRRPAGGAAASPLPARAPLRRRAHLCEVGHHRPLVLHGVAQPPHGLGRVGRAAGRGRRGPGGPGPRRGAGDERGQVDVVLRGRAALRGGHREAPRVRACEGRRPVDMPGGGAGTSAADRALPNGRGSAGECVDRRSAPFVKPARRRERWRPCSALGPTFRRLARRRTRPDASVDVVGRQDGPPCERGPGRSCSRGCAVRPRPRILPRQCDG